MAQRRMMTKTITNSARFIKMPKDSQALYFHLCMNADDDGIVEAFSIMKQIDSGEDNLRVLSAKNFVKILNEDLVTYITDWNEHNTIRADRKINSVYQKLLVQLLPEAQIINPKPRSDVKDNSNRLEGGQSTDSPRTAEVRLGKDRKEQYTAGKPAPSAKDSFLKAKEFQAPDPRKNPHGIIIDFYFNRVKELYGFEPEINGKKDGQLLKTRLTKYKPTQICALIDWYLHSDISERLGCSLATALSANTINRWKQENGNK
jgi:hypothetical protein